MSEKTPDELSRAVAERLGKPDGFKDFNGPPNLEAMSGTIPRDFATNPKDWGWLLEREKIGVFPDMGGGWHAEWRKQPPPVEAIHAYADTPGEAICRAFLEATDDRTD